MYGLRVLLVDDHPISRKVATLLLQGLDIELLEAANGEEALAVLASEKIDIVLLDMIMPVMGGSETIRHIRASGELWSAIPVVAISAGALGDTEERYLQLGLDGYVAKPLTSERLIAELTRLAPFSPHARGEHPAPLARPAIPREGH